MKAGILATQNERLDFETYHYRRRTGFRAALEDMSKASFRMLR